MASKLFIGGLAWATTDESLRAFFSQYGNVVSASVIKDKMSGKSKGFGFVEFETEAEAEAAKAATGQMLDGRTVSVSEAKPQAPRENNRFGGNSTPRGNWNRY